MSQSAPAGQRLEMFEAFESGAIHAALEGIVTVDEEQRIVMINPAAQRMFGCSAAEALGSELSRFIPERFRERHARHFANFDASQAVEVPMQTRGHIVGLRANGEEFAAEASISRLEVAQDGGTRRYFTALLRDLTRELDLRAEIDALNRQMRAIFDLAPVAIWIADAEHIVFANRACAGLFGADQAADMIGRSIFTLLCPESHAMVRAAVERALAHEAPAMALCERIRRLDGTERDVEIAVARLPDHGATSVQMVINDITERSRERLELERSRREFRQLSASLVQAREDERRGIARELHDELGQWLTALKMELSSLLPAVPAAGAQARVQAMIGMVDETVRSVRRIATDLRPLMLDELGLSAAIEALARESERRLDLHIQLRLDPSTPPLKQDAAIAVYRMIQEALTNVARHAQASEVGIEFRVVGKEVVLTVHDNGVGFSERSMFRDGSHGLMGIRERAYMFGGQLEIGAAQRAGGCVTVRLPLGRVASANGTRRRRDAS